MDRDDMQVGRLLTRREAMALLGMSGVALLAGPPRGLALALGANAGAPSCVVLPEQTEGPYFVDERLNRADIRMEPASGEITAGAPLELVMTVARIASGGCIPVAGAQVDLWQCDASGIYSDVTDPGFNRVGRKLLRGYQVTDANGTVRFTTIYPGWYPGRTVHIHFKVRTTPESPRGHEFTSQLYFDDSFTDRVFTRQPYVGRGPRPVRNQGDGIFRRGGEQLMLDVRAKGNGYAAKFDLGLQVT